MRALSTSDVPLETLRELSSELSPDLELEVSESQVVLLSAEPPSWVTFLAEADWWIKPLAAYAALYVAEIVKEAAKDTWKNRGKVIAAVISASNGIKKLATGIAKLRQKLSSNTTIRIALPIQDDYSATRLELLGSDPDDLALQIALFVHHLPGLTALIQSEGLDGSRVLGAIFLKILPDASLEVSWMDKDSFATQRRVLPLEDAA